MSEDNKFIGFHVSERMRQRLKKEARDESIRRGSRVSVAEILRRLVTERFGCR